MLLRERAAKWPACLATAFLVALLVAGCAASPSLPASSSTAAPTAALVPSSTVAEPVGTPGGDAAALLREAVQRQTAVQRVRGRIALEIDDAGDNSGEPITTTIEFEYAKPNVRLTARQRPGAPPRADMILTANASYFKAENSWLATTPGTRPTEVRLLGFDRVPSFLRTPAKPRLLARREVRGAVCDVISFDLAADKVQELADLAAFKRGARDGVTIDRYEADAALGTDDRLIRHMSFVFGGHDNGGPKSPFVQRVDVDLWDFDAPDISVEPPAQGELLDLGKLLPPNATPVSQ